MKSVKVFKKIIVKILIRKPFTYIPDSIMVKIKYRLLMGKKLNLKNPKTFNEKLQWLKLHDRNTKYIEMADKYEAKEYVGKIIGNKYIIPTIAVYNTFDEIDFEELPNQFVIKCTHDSGGIVICRDKKSLNIENAKKIINKSLKRNYYFVNREWPYKNIKPRIIIEKYMEDNEGKSLKDYKFFCFDGKPTIMYISSGLEDHSRASMSFYDMDFNLLDCKRKDFKQINEHINKPKNWEIMKRYSAKLSKNIPHVRVDWYEINNELYFGELTFTTCGGYIPFEDEKWDKKIGDMLIIKK